MSAEQQAAGSDGIAGEDRIATGTSKPLPPPRYLSGFGYPTRNSSVVMELTITRRCLLGFAERFVPARGADTPATKEDANE